jgi:hypothetical protein
MKLNVIFLAIVLFLSGVLSGCSLSIIHPPSASAFMEKGDGDLQKNVTISLTYGTQHSIDGAANYVPYEDVKRKHPREDYHYTGDREMPAQFSLDVQKIIGNFKFGFGVDWVTPFLQAGFISDYFGVMGWSNACLWQIEKYEHAFFQWGGGITIIEQLPLSSRRLRIGLTQHISRNGREAYADEDGALFVSYSAPVFYDEIGAGAYVAWIAKRHFGLGLEFRYGRDLTYKIVNNGREMSVDRFSLAFNFQWW